MFKITRNEMVIIIFIFFEMFLIGLFVYPRDPTHSSIENNNNNNNNSTNNRTTDIERRLIKNTALEKLREKIMTEIHEDRTKIKWWGSNGNGVNDNETTGIKYQLVLVVSTAPQRFDRRNAIRQSWWQLCRNNTKVKCVFFTDGILDDQATKSRLLEENKLHKDIHVQPLTGGLDFGVRFLYQLRSVSLAYEFDYFMRLDDDEFLCFDRLIHDLQFMPKENFIWSWVHCEKQLVRPEESFLIISQDVVHKFLMQDSTTIKCHPLADQQLGVWVNELGLKDLYYHDTRIHHHPPAASLPEMLKITNVCQTFLAIHGSYPTEMKYFWDNQGKYDPASEHILAKPLKSYCNFPQYMNWQAFGELWIFEPHPCIENHKWDTSKLLSNGKKFYGGRETELIAVDPKYLTKKLETKESELKQCEEKYVQLHYEKNELEKKILKILNNTK